MEENYTRSPNQVGIKAQDIDITMEVTRSGKFGKLQRRTMKLHPFF